MGSLIVHTRFPGIDDGMVSPYVRGASSLNHSKKPAAYVTSPRASPTGLPFSHVMRVVRSSTFSIMRSYHLRSSLERSRPVLFRNDSKAASAAEMAFSVSSAANSGQVPINLPVDGSEARVEVSSSLNSRRSWWGRRWKRLWNRRTIDLKCLARLGLDPLAVDEADILLEQRRIFELSQLLSFWFLVESLPALGPRTLGTMADALRRPKYDIPGKVDCRKAFRAARRAPGADALRDVKDMMATALAAGSSARRRNWGVFVSQASAVPLGRTV